MTWRRVRQRFARWVQLGVFVVAIGFGLDYLASPPSSAGVFTVIEQTIVPLWAWAATIIAAGVIGLFVEWRILGDDHPILITDTRWRWGWATNTAHAVLFGLFTSLTGSSLYDITMRGVETGQWYGWRTALMWGGFAALNLAFVPRAKGSNP